MKRGIAANLETGSKLRPYDKAEHLEEISLDDPYHILGKITIKV